MRWAWRWSALGSVLCLAFAVFGSEPAAAQPTQPPPSKLKPTLPDANDKPVATPIAAVPVPRSDAELDAVLLALAAPDGDPGPRPDNPTTLDFALAPEPAAGFLDGLTEISHHRDWMTFVDGERCTAAVWASASNVDPYDSPSPAILLETERGWNGSDMVIYFAWPLLYDVDGPSHAMVAGRRYPLAVLEEGWLDFAVTRGHLDSSVLPAMRRGNDIEIWGAQGGRQIGFRFSARGFTAAFRAIMDECSMPGLAVWLE